MGRMIRRRQVLTFIAAIALIVGGLLVSRHSFIIMLKVSGNDNGEQQYERLDVVVSREETNQVQQQQLTLHHRVDKSGVYSFNQDLKGSTFDSDGLQSNITATIKSELVYSFSPSSEEFFASKIVDPNREQKVFANSPAMIWKDGRFVVVMRMWLDEEITLKKVQNKYSDNYFYMRTFSESMEPLDKSGRVLGMPTTVSADIGDGPIEPRAFPFYDQYFLSFNTAVRFNRKQVDTTMFWNMDEDIFVMPEISKGQPQLNSTRTMPRDKHWSAYTWNEKVYLIYSLDPLRILKCNRDAKCSFAQNAAPSGYTFKDSRDCLRGGTPTLQYRDNYYIKIAHSTLFRKNPEWKRFYTINLVVLRATSEGHEIVYLSEPINFHPKLMSSVPMVRSEFILDPFFFPVSLLMEDDDNIIIGGHINDHSAYLFRVSGIKSLMEKIMTEAEHLKKTGPAPGFLHNLSKSFASSQSNYEFIYDAQY